MNYYSMNLQDNPNAYMLERMACCAAAEASLESTDFDNPAYVAVGDTIAQALFERFSVIVWNIPVTGYTGKKRELFQESDEIVSSLPATVYVGEYKNKLTKHILRTYVTNLQEEWT